MSQFLQLLSSPFSGSMSCCRNTSTGKVEGTSSQWLCWTFLLPYVLPFEGGLREDMYTWDEQEKLPVLLFHFPGCYHIVLLAGNCNCQLKHWGKLFCCCVWHEPHVCISKAGTSVCCWGWLREEICSHSVELILYNALECPALHSLTWFTPNKVHVFIILFPHTVS